MTNKIQVEYVSTSLIKANEYNPKKFSKEALDGIRTSITNFGFVDGLIVNKAENRMNILIGGHARLQIAKELQMEYVPVIYVDIPDIKNEKELNLRLHKNQGEFDIELLAQFDESILSSIGFNSEELDEIFAPDPLPEQFDLQKELEKLNIKQVTVQKGDKYEIDGSILMCGDSTIESDMLKLMDGVQADMVMTDPPYILD